MLKIIAFNDVSRHRGSELRREPVALADGALQILDGPFHVAPGVIDVQIPINQVVAQSRDHRATVFALDFMW
jgi:hypothetical protein